MSASVGGLFANAVTELVDADPAAIAEALASAAQLTRGRQSKLALERAARAAGGETKAGRPPVWSDDRDLREARAILAEGLEPSWNRAIRRVAKKYSADPRTIRSVAERLRRKAKALECKK